MKKLAIITTHPIQYQIPLFKSLKKYNIKPIVFFASKHGINNKFDHEFLNRINWNINSNLISGYKSYFPKYQKYKINDFRLSFKNFEKILLKEKVKFILIFGWNNIHYLKSIYYSHKHKLKIILRVETNLYSTKNFFKKILKKFFLKFFFNFFDKFLYIGKLNRDFYLKNKVPFKKLVSAPYFVDNKFFVSNISKSNLKKKLRIKSKKVVLFVGKFLPRKNPIEFIRLAEKFKKNDDIIFLMIGNGEMKEECHEFVKKNKLKNVLLLGFVNQKKIKEFYWISDLLVVPSFYETWGLNINEAFASKTPVICTSDCGASVDLIEQGKTGFKYKVGDLSSLYKKTYTILNNQKLYKKMIKKIKIKIEKHNIDKTLRSINKIIYEN